MMIIAIKVITIAKRMINSEWCEINKIRTRMRKGERKKINFVPHSCSELDFSQFVEYIEAHAYIKL